MEVMHDVFHEAMKVGQPSEIYTEVLPISQFLLSAVSSVYSLQLSSFKSIQFAVKLIFNHLSCARSQAAQFSLNEILFHCINLVKMCGIKMVLRVKVIK